MSRLIKYSILFTIISSFIFCQAKAKHIRDSWQHPAQIMDSIGVKPGMIIGEAGAGDGYFTFHLSNRIGVEGKIYANDIVNSKLEDIREHCEENNIKNIATILGEEKDPLFPVGQMDMVVMMYVFHDLTKPVPFLVNIKKCLKPGATVVIIDRDPERYGEQYDHFMKKSEILEEIKKANYILLDIKTFLPRDNIYIAKPANLN